MWNDLERPWWAPQTDGYFSLGQAWGRDKAFPNQGAEHAGHEVARDRRKRTAKRVLHRVVLIVFDQSSCLNAFLNQIKVHYQPTERIWLARGAEDFSPSETFMSVLCASRS